MPMIPQKPKTKQYKISMTSKNGNTVASVYLSGAFLKAMTQKQEKHITFADIKAINDSDLIGFLEGLEMKLEEIQPQIKQEAKDF